MFCSEHGFETANPIGFNGHAGMLHIGGAGSELKQFVAVVHGEHNQRWDALVSLLVWLPLILQRPSRCVVPQKGEQRMSIG